MGYSDEAGLKADEGRVSRARNAEHGLLGALGFRIASGNCSAVLRREGCGHVIAIARRDLPFLDFAASELARIRCGSGVVVRCWVIKTGVDFECSAVTMPALTSLDESWLVSVLPTFSET